MNGPWVPALLQLLRTPAAPGVPAQWALIDGSSTKALGTACPVPFSPPHQITRGWKFHLFLFSSFWSVHELGTMATCLVARSHSLRRLFIGCFYRVLNSYSPMHLWPLLSPWRSAALFQKAYRKLEQGSIITVHLGAYIKGTTFPVLLADNSFELSRSRLFYFVTSNCSRVTVRLQFLLKRA